MELQNKIGIFSDTHLGLAQDSNMWHNISLDFAKWAAEEFQNRGINQILIPGDIFHNRNEINVYTLSIAKEFFNFFKGFDIFISTGNHCCFYKDNSTVNSISILSGWNNIKIFDKDPVIFTHKNKKISMIPWGTDIEKIPKTDICFGHFEINTFYMNTFKVCDKGIESKSILNKSPLVFSGHFHGRDDRKYSNGRIVYIGSPYQQNFGDVDSIRGIYTLDIEKEEITFIENKISPVHIKIFLSKLRNKKQDTAFLSENVPNNIVSLVIDEDIEADKIVSLSTKIQSLKPKHFRIDCKQSIENSIENTDNTDYNMVNIEKNIEDFVNSTDVQHKEDVIEYLLDIYKEINT